MQLPTGHRPTSGSETSTEEFTHVKHGCCSPNSSLQFKRAPPLTMNGTPTLWMHRITELYFIQCYQLQTRKCAAKTLKCHWKPSLRWQTWPPIYCQWSDSGVGFLLSLNQRETLLVFIIQDWTARNDRVNKLSFRIFSLTSLYCKTNTKWRLCAEISQDVGETF